MRAALLAIFVLLCALPATAPARGLTTGFYDGALFGADASERLDEVVKSRAGIVRVGVSWPGVAPKPPANPRDPADPGYRWDGVDAAVAASTTKGLQVMLSIDQTPEWAEQGSRRQRRRALNYKPDPRATGAFATAVARRYAGSVKYLQLFNEPNLATYLAPQYEHGRPFAAVRYREMLNESYAGVHAAGLKLVTAGTAPYGDPGPRAHRTRPVRFWRTVLGRRVRFDVLAHHPYAVGGPRQHAFSRLDVAVPDVHRLVSLVRSAVRRGRALPRRSKPTWVTEISWDSRPPDPHGVPMRRHAHWLADSFFVLWKQGVDHVFWFQVRDQAPQPSYAATNQSGVYFRGGKPKLAQRAFAFPFSCERHGSGTRIWVKAPSAGRVSIVDSAGHVLERVSPGSDRVASATVGGRKNLHAVSGGTASISCQA